MLFVLEIIHALADLGIVGGQDANIADHPWQVAIFSDCGGALISQEWVLTSAQCSFTNSQIRAGSNDSRSGGVLVDIDQIILHPYFNLGDSYLDYDVALAHLSSPISGTNIRPVVLPSQGEEIQNDSFFNVTGWGNLNENDETLPLLQEVTIPTISTDICKTAYKFQKGPSMVINVTDNMFCGGFWEDGGKSPCQKDTGGPAVWNGKIIGIVSWEFGCAQPKFPAVFTKVSKFIDWIYDETGIEVC